MSAPTILDLGPAARAVAAVVTAIPDDRLGDPTPCDDMTVAALLHHLYGLAWAFRAAAEKDPAAADAAPQASADDLPADWRTAIPARLDALAEAWRDPAAWAGTTGVGGMQLPGEAAGTITADELVLHGWDLAAATGQVFTPDPDAVAAVLAFTQMMSGPEHDASRDGLFGPVVAVPETAPPLERALGYSGRDPQWAP
ncbi:TIGR03086 family metal-binding protein [Pseudonocardia phyllosphaerae]|uniref:TIGR03086 family metal-binding protein n=1 Tax=Pseudonocardia phyllosphaerae TaxID=3390502 RepID=UPI003978B33A